MTVSLMQRDARADAPSSAWRDAAIVAATVLATMTLPLAIYGYLSWRQFEYFSLSYFVPYEAMRAELERPTLAKVVSLPLVEVNMTSGHILANMYTLTLGQFVLSSMLALVMGLVITGRKSRRKDGDRPMLQTTLRPALASLPPARQCQSR